MFNPQSISPLFSPFKDIQAVEYQGPVREHQIVFRCAHNHPSPEELLVMSLIRSQEESFWESFRETLIGGLAEAALQARGKFLFSLISIQLHQGLAIFQWREFSQLVINHSRKLAVGESRLIQYCSLFGVLTKQAQSDWGKLNFYSPITVFDKKPRQLNLKIKKLLKLQKERGKSARLICYDLSRQPIYDANDEEQQQRLVKTLTAENSQADEKASVVFINCRGVFPVSSKIAENCF